MADPLTTRRDRLPCVPIGAVRLRVRNPDVVRALEQAAWAGPPRLLKSEGQARTWSGSVEIGADVVEVVLKRVPERRGVKRTLHRATSSSPCFRQWRGVEALQQADVSTSRPLALLRGDDFEWLILERIPGDDALRTIAAMAQNGVGLREEHTLASALGDLVERMTEAGLRNRDHKLSNLIVTPDGDIAVIDTVGVQQGVGGAERMLYAMAAEARGVGVLPRRALLMRVLRSAGVPVKETWRSIERSLSRAGDTTPRVNPLADATSQ